MTTANQEVRASHLLVETEEEAQRLRDEITSGSLSFADAARNVSKCPSGAQGGDLGFFGKGRMVPQFEQAAFAMQVEELSNPIQTQFGWHLLLVTDAR
jgi:peptidyl-prolyl cis-trans isomerase C